MQNAKLKMQNAKLKTGKTLQQKDKKETKTQGGTR